MRFFYLDASAVAKRYIPEPGTALVNHLFASAPPDRFYVLNVGVAEVLSLLVRRKNSGHLPAAAFSRALVDFGAEIVHPAIPWKLAVDTPLVIAALSFVETHSLNATDAIILRSALDLAGLVRAGADDLVLVTSDRRLLRAARADRLETFDPENQSQADLDALLAP